MLALTGEALPSRSLVVGTTVGSTTLAAGPRRQRGFAHARLADDGEEPPLSDSAREQARHVFLRLIQPGEGTEDTRRRVAVNEITSSDDGNAAEVIQRFVDAWLLTVSVDELTNARLVEISHEAVITGRDRCRRWVDENRTGLLVHRRLTLAAQEWERHGRTADVLYRGVPVPLAEALAWRTRAPGRLNVLEGEFHDAASAFELVKHRSRRRRVVLALIAILVLVVAIAAGVVANIGQSEANHLHAIATSRLLAAEATFALSTDVAVSQAPQAAAAPARRCPATGSADARDPGPRWRAGLDA